MQHNKPRIQRHLAWDGCYNARDLGGLPTVEGSETRWRAVIRSDLLNRLSSSGLQAMLDYGVRTIIDLRGSQEAQTEPSVFATPTKSIIDREGKVRGRILGVLEPDEFEEQVKPLLR